MNALQYTTVDRVLAKVHRDLRGINLNESDAIEWIGEALEFLKVRQIQEEDNKWLQVKDYESDIPDGLQLIIQVTRCNETLIEEGEEIDLSNICKEENTTPIRLANGTFYNSIVCRNKDDTLYQNCEDEYTIVGTIEKKLRFSFDSGYVSLSYIKNALDKETGYPLVPDNASYMSAITYYIKWKMAERYDWSGRRGAAQQAAIAEKNWLKYARQAKNYMKMPKTLDDFQDLLEQTHYLIPRQKRYYGYFGKIGKGENISFNVL